MTRAAALAIALALMLLAPAGASAASHTLTVDKQGFQKGTVTSTPAGIVCGSTCSAPFDETCDANGCTPTLVTLTTTLPTGFTVSWQGETCQGPGETQTGTACTVPANDNTVTARFIDATAPTISLTSPSSDGPFGGSLHMAASAFDSQSNVSRVDFTIGSTVVGSTTTSPYELDFDTSTIPDGQISVGAVAYNGDGQAKTANPRSITLDNTPPALTITAGPDGQTFGPNTTQAYSFTTTDASSVATVCSLDSDKNFSACNDTVAYTDQPEGLHTFRVHALDAAGNETDATRTFSIDRTGPTTTITAGPADFSSGTLGTALFTFSAGEPGAAFSCRLYSAGSKVPDFGACSGPNSHSAAGLQPGDWTFEVFAADAYGNAGPVAARRFSVVFGSTQDSVKAGLAALFRVHGAATTVRKLRLAKLPIGTRVAVTCKGHGCAFHKRTVAERHGRVTLEQLFRGRALRTGATIELRITAAGLTGEFVRFRTRRARQPLRTSMCLPAGSKNPVACS